MTFVDTLLAFFQREAEDTADQTPDGACPNCWGWEEWDNVVRTAMKDKQIDVNNHREGHAFIKQFTVEHIDGIRLRKHEDGQYKCERCQTLYHDDPAI